MHTRFFCMRFPDARAKAVTLSYDDGAIDDVRLMQILDKYGLKCTFNLNSGLYAEDDELPPPGKTTGYKMTYDQMTKLYKDTPHEVALHGYTHPHFSRLSQAQVAYDVIKDREQLEKQFGTIVRGLAYPFGSYSDEVVEALRVCGVAYARTVVSTFGFDVPTDWLRMPATCHHTSPRLNEMIEKFLEAKTTAPRQPMLFYLWGHSFEFGADDSWNIIEDFGQRVGGRDDIWYATNIEIHDYVESFRSLIWSADMSRVYNPTCTTVWFNFGDSYGTKDYCVKPGETLVFE